MGAVELQVFASLVVVLGAAFVALICDFLKGSNEQLRESNIELRIRQFEQEQREAILSSVQRQAIEALAQARAPVSAVPVRQSIQPSAVADRPDSYERSQQERSQERSWLRHESRHQQHPPPIAAPAGIEMLQRLPLPLGIAEPPAPRSAPASTAAISDLYLPKTGLCLEKPIYEIVAAAPPTAAKEQTMPDSPVVRIRVLSEDDFLPAGDSGSTRPAAPLAGPEPVTLPAPFHAPLAVAALEPAITAGVMSPAIPSAKFETTFLAGQEYAPAVETRSNVLKMPAAPVNRSTEYAAPDCAELVIPGGFHDAQVLARLLEDERPFQGLSIVISVVDYVRLMADQGKPAAEQLLGSISRLVMSLTREQDFACRIAEDEFVVLFAGETGTAAKRRIQVVSERLWDFQLRSLGTVSVIFSWGASESTTEALVHSVEFAREQMLESRRNRRALASGVGRFRRRAVNS